MDVDNSAGFVETDKVILRRIPFNLTLGRDAWGRDKPQPVEVTLEVQYDLRNAAATDHVLHTLDYGKLYKSLNQQLDGKSWSLLNFVVSISEILEPNRPFDIEINLPKGNLYAQGGIQYSFSFMKIDEQLSLSQQLRIKGIECSCIVGVNPHEREEKQIVRINLEFRKIFNASEHEATEFANILQPNIEEAVVTIPYANLTRTVVQRVEGSAFQTVEALANAVAKTVTVDFDIPAVAVSVEKPNAIAAIEAAGVRIFRRKDFFTNSNYWQVRQP